MRYWHLFLGVLLAALVGYSAYALYPRFALGEQTLSLPLLAIAAGLASFFSPCSFSLMAALLARESGVNDQRTSSASVRRTSGFAVALALGATAFFALAGIGLAVGGSALFASVTFTSVAGRIIRLLTGSTLIVLGLMQLEKLPNVLTAAIQIASPLMRYQARHRGQAPALSFFVFGFAYPLAGFG